MAVSVCFACVSINTLSESASPASRVPMASLECLCKISTEPFTIKESASLEAPKVKISEWAGNVFTSAISASSEISCAEREVKANIDRTLSLV